MIKSVIRWITATFILFASISSIFGQAAGNARYNLNFLPQMPAAPQFGNDNFFQVSAKVLMNVPADEQLAIFHLIQIGETASEAHRFMNGRINGFVEDLDSAGISSENLFIDMLSQIPIFEYEVQKKPFSKTYNEIPKGIELQKNIHIRFKEGNQLNILLELAARHEIYDLVKIEYFVKDIKKVQDSIRSLAIHHIHDQLKDYAKLGMELDTAFRVVADEFAAAYPFSRYRPYDGFSTVSIDVVKKRTEVNSVRKPKTLYYDKIPYESYDIVVDPEFLEPPVQFTYDLAVKYTIKKNPPQTIVKQQKEFLLLTPEGNLKQLKVE